MIELGKNKTTLKYQHISSSQVPLLAAAKAYCNNFHLANYGSCAIVAVLRFATILVARLLGLMLSTLFVVGLPNW